MKKIFIFIVSCCTSFGFDYTPEEIAGMHEGLARWSALAKSAGSLPPEEAIPQLGEGLRKTARTNIYVYGDREGVFRELQEALLSIPGHAEYYADQVREARREFDEASQEWKGPPAVNLQNVQGRSFGTLAHLPSVETVRVLGEFLSDEKGYFLDVTPPGVPVSEDRKGTGPAFFYATQAFNTLPLVSKPFQKEHAYQIGYDDVHPWRLWYEQVKAGTRTFRFEGDPQEYNLDGPVREARHGPATNRTVRRDAADGRLTGEQATGFTPFRMILTGMAVLLCLWALWRCWKMRPQRAG